MTAPLPWVLLVAVLGGVVGAMVTHAIRPEPPAVTSPQVAPRGPLAPDEAQTADLFRRGAPSVVFITTIDGPPSAAFEVTAHRQGAGSGFIWDRRGHIITSWHVVRDASGVVVTLSDQSSWVAKVVGASPKHDLAVLGIDAPESALKPMVLGSSHDLVVGQRLFAIGNPFGLDHSLTTGVVSALDRTIAQPGHPTLSGMIQSDARINPGNSGGPMLDSAGRVVGVSTAVSRLSAMGFALPIDVVISLVPQLIEKGHVRRPRLGLRVARDATAKRLGIKGVLVLGVTPDSPAAEAGIRGTRHDGRRLILGDQILKLGKRRVRRSVDLAAALRQARPGEPLTLKLMRDGHPLSVELTPSSSARAGR